MQALNNVLIAFWQEESGLTIVEYALTGALIAVVAITGLTTLGTNIEAKLTTIAGLVK